MKLRCCKNKATTTELTEAVSFLKVIAEENRLKIMCMLRSGERCVCEIWQYLNVPQNLASHHLKILKDFGLVDDRKDGLKIYYAINKKNTIKYNSLLNKFLQSYGK